MKTTYVPGKWLSICDVCSLRYYNDQLKKDWRGLMVCDADFETRHPQDLIRVRGDNKPIPWVRPEGNDVFIPETYICTLEGKIAIAFQAVAGCAIAGSVNGVLVNRTAIAGIAISGYAISGKT